MPNESADVAIVSYDPVGCLGEHTTLVEGEPGAGHWASVYPEQRPFDVVTTGRLPDSAIARILVFEPVVATAEGVRIGSSLVELLAAYPDITAGDEIITRLYTLTDSAGSLVFEVAADNAPAGYWTPEQLNTVVFITAHAPGEKLGAIYATDSAGSCPV